MKCVILQPSYMPWRGYFHQIWKADCFIFYDDVQYDARGWRNRNRVKTPHGPRWLTLPVHSKGCQIEGTPIRDIRICRQRPWQAKHWRTLEQSYGRAPFFAEYAPLVHDFYTEPWDYLCDLTTKLTVRLSRALGNHHTRFVRASELGVTGARTDRIVRLLQRVGATHYITGPSAKTYLEEHKLAAAGITVEYMRYDYPEYPQLYPPFDGQVSILDLLFMTGPKALDYVLPDVPERFELAARCA